MLSAIACTLCGGDPATEAMLINVAVAGVVGTPWIFRDKLAALVRRLRGKPEVPEASCAITPDEDDGP